jgi:ABC-type transport system involved in multi-copper enzyme maturation permease subunit
MPSRAIKPRRDDDQFTGGWQGLREQAPSLVRPEQPTAGRVIALIALFPLTLGAAALLFAAIGRGYLISPSWGVLLLALGVSGLLYHAFNEKELQYRRLYGMVGLVLLGLGILFRLLPAEVGGLGGNTFLPYGAPALLLALGFLGSFIRNETDPVYRKLTLNGLGIVGAACAGLGLLGGLVNEEFMVGQGVVLLLLGLVYLAVYIVLQEAGSNVAYWAGFAVGALGVLMIVISLGWSLLPSLAFSVGWLESRPVGTFFMPRGLLLLYLGLEYLLLGVGVCSESKFVVLTRRELAAFFYSPIAYIVLIGGALIGWLSFAVFANLLGHPRFGGLTTEDVVHGFVWGVIPVFSVVFMVPLLTMRLLSEERRTGSLEVLLTAPVNETPVVLAKFFATLRIFLLSWYPWALYLLALRLEAGEWFDYRPMLAFFIALIVMGAGWIAMGLFFSSLTRNQIAAAAMTLVAMLALTGAHLLRVYLQAEGTLGEILTHISFIDLWGQASQGQLAPRMLAFHLTMAVFWLFLTVKVLEARKWA